MPNLVKNSSGSWFSVGGNPPPPRNYNSITLRKMGLTQRCGLTFIVLAMTTVRILPYLIPSFDFKKVENCLSYLGFARNANIYRDALHFNPISTGLCDSGIAQYNLVQTTWSTETL